MPRIHPAPSLDVLIRYLPDEGPQSLPGILPEAEPVDARGRYLPWHRLQYREPPEGQTIRSWWVGTRLSRLAGSRRLALLDKGQRPFRLTRTDQLLDKIEQFERAATQIEDRIQDAVLTPETPLFDESIASSQFEGSGTTTPVAHAMLVAGRRPRNLDERMIANNLQAMEAAAFCAREITPRCVRWTSWNCIGSWPTEFCTIRAMPDACNSPASRVWPSSPARASCMNHLPLCNCPIGSSESANSQTRTTACNRSSERSCCIS